MTLFFKKHTKPLTTLVLTLGLTACGGYTTVDLGGHVLGLVTDGLVLQNGSDTVAVPANATKYVFPNQIDAHGDYNVTVKSSPAHYTCVIPSPSGRASGLTIDYVDVHCSRASHTIGGVVTGLTSTGLTLINGADTIALAANATSYTFLGRVMELDPYGVAVLQQPTDQICSVQNGTATMGAGDVSNILVTCVNK